MRTEADIAVALIGYGYAGKTFHAPLIAATPGLRLATIVSREAGKVHADLADVRVAADARIAIDDPQIDLVVIATPNDTHAGLADTALRAGRHVVVDKPFTLTLAEARALAQQADRCNRVLSVFHNRRWDSDFLGVRQAIADGLIGDVMHLEAHFDRFRPLVRDRWRERDVPGGGIWFDLGPHLVDQALQLLGLPTAVTASFAIQRDGGVSADWAHVILDYGRQRAILHAGMLVAGGVPRFVVHGTRGSVVKAGMDVQEAQLLRGMRPGDARWGVDDDALQLFDGSGAAPRALPAPAGDQRCYYAALRDAVRGTGDNPVTPLQAVAVMAVLEAASASARSAASVPLPLSDAERAAWLRMSI
ncbi:MAG: oxidoreductase [Luteimonas sp.]